MALPRLNSYVYIVTRVDCEPYCVSRDKVYMKNKNAFIVEEAFYDYVIDEYRTEHTEEDEGVTWCKTLKEVKQILKDDEKAQRLFGKYDVKYKLVKLNENNWNVEKE